MSDIVWHPGSIRLHHDVTVVLSSLVHMLSCHVTVRGRPNPNERVGAILNAEIVVTSDCSCMAKVN